MSERQAAENDAPACVCPTDDYCPKCHPRWYAKWRGAARIVGHDLSEEARDLARAEGWSDHARMHPATATEYESRATPPTKSDDDHGATQ